MNGSLKTLLTKILSKFKKKCDDTYVSKNDPNTNIKVKNATVRNLEISYTDENGDKKTGKVKSDLTPYDTGIYNLGSNQKAWKTLYLAEKLFFDKNGALIEPIRVSDDGKVSILNPVTGYSAISVKDDITIRSKNGDYLITLNDFGFRITCDGNPVFSSNNSARLKLDDDSILATNGKMQILPDCHNRDNIQVSENNRIIFGGMHHLEDDSSTIDTIMCYKRGDANDMDTVPFGISKSGEIYYKGKELDSKYKLYQHNISMNYSKSNVYFHITLTITSYISSPFSKNYFIYQFEERDISCNGRGSDPNFLLFPYAVRVASDYFTVYYTQISKPGTGEDWDNTDYGDYTNNLSFYDNVIEL